MSMQTRHQPGRALHRPRPLQAGQRLLRPLERRRGPPRPGPAGSRRRPSGPATWSAGSPVTSSSCCAATSATSQHAVSAGQGVLAGPGRRPVPALHRSRRSWSRAASGVSFVDARAPDRPGHPPAGRHGHVPGQEQGPVAQSRSSTSRCGSSRWPASRSTTTCATRSSNDELAVHYQPIASVANGKIVAIEALVRWNHPSRGLLGPMEFIPFAEETDLIFSLGRWVLREACHTMARWRAGAVRAPRTPTSPSTSRSTS